MTSLRPLLMLALLAWVVVADQGARECCWPLGVKVGWERVAWFEWAADTGSHRVRKGRCTRASTPPGSVSVTSSVLTTRAAVPTSWPSASPKVRAERLGGPGVPGAAGDSILPCSLPKAVTAGDVFHLPEDEQLGPMTTARCRRSTAQRGRQPESPTLAPTLQAEIPVQAPGSQP